MKRTDAANYFYQSNVISSVLQASRACRSMRALNLVLAQKSTDKIPDPGLLAVEIGGSVLGVYSHQETETHKFTAYGYDPSLPSSSTILGFNAEWIDTWSKSYILGNGYRGFSPELMRFLSPDSLSPFDDGGVNGYAYCAGDPINHLDPSGHMLLGKAYHLAVTAALSATPKPRSSNRAMMPELQHLIKERTHLKTLEPGLKEDQKKLMKYSYNNPGKLEQAHKRTQNQNHKNKIAKSGHWNANSAYRQHVEAQEAAGSLKHLYNSNPGLREMYNLHLITSKLENKILSLDKKIIDLRAKEFI